MKTLALKLWNITDFLPTNILNLIFYIWVSITISLGLLGIAGINI